MKARSVGIKPLIGLFFILVSSILVCFAVFSSRAYGYELNDYKINNDMWYVTSSVFADETRVGFRDRMRAWNVYLPEGKRVCFNSATHSLSNYPSKDNHNYIYKDPYADESNLGENMCWYYPVLGILTESDININSNQPWDNGAVSGRYDVQSVMLHELGHTIGLGHSQRSDAVMYAYMNSGITKRALTSDDIAGVNARIS